MVNRDRTFPNKKYNVNKHIEKNMTFWFEHSSSIYFWLCEIFLRAYKLYICSACLQSVRISYSNECTEGRNSRQEAGGTRDKKSMRIKKLISACRMTNEWNCVSGNRIHILEVENTSKTMCGLRHLFSLCLHQNGP